MSNSDRPRSSRPLWLGVGIGALALFLAGYGVDWSELGAAVGGADPVFLGCGVAVFLANLLLRALRWKLVMHPLGRFRVMGDCLPFYMIGYMSNMLLPLRAGELIRPFLFGRKQGISRSAVLASVAVERMADLLSMLCMLLVLVAAMEISEEWQGEVRLTAFALTAFLVVTWALSRRMRGEGGLDWLLVRLPTRLSEKISSLVNKLSQGLESIHDVKSAMRVLLSSLAIWASTFLVVTSYVKAFGMEVPWYAPLFLIVVSNLGLAVPSSPGGVGVAHFLYVASLSVFGVSKSSAFALAIVMHGVGFILVVGIGLVALWREGLNWAAISRMQT